MPKREYARLGETVWYDDLPNGLRIVTVPRKGFRTASACYMVFCGGVDRFGLPAGTAHFLEHKLFERQDGEDALTVFTRRGAYANAFTAQDVTAYHFTSTEQHYKNLESLLSLVNDPAFTEAGVEREKPIILREIEMSEDEPDSALYQGLLRCLFRASPLREPILGTRESVAEITADSLRQYYKEYYVPANSILTLVGPWDRERVLALAQKYTPRYVTLPPDRRYPRERGEAPFRRRQEAAMDVAAPLFLCGIKTSPAPLGEKGARQEQLAALALNTLMGEASPLWTRLYEEGLVNETFSYDYETAGGVSFLSFGGEAADEKAVLEAVFAEAERLSREGIPADYFRRRKKCAAGDELRALDSPADLAINLAIAGLYHTDYMETLPTLLSLTEEEICTFLGTWFKPQRAAVSRIIPKEADA